MSILEILENFWFLILTALILIVGAIIRIATKQPFKGNVPAVGYYNDLPDSVFPKNEREDLAMAEENDETICAYKEADEIRRDQESSKRYSSTEEMFEDILK